jgi:hypothetical protein
MTTRLVNMRYNGDGLYSFLYEDGLRAELDFNGFPGAPWTEFTECFRSENFLSKAYLDHGVMTWPNSYDICPDVLRFWCEQGRITTQAETNSHFCPA